MKILVVIDSLRWGGAENLLTTFIRGSGQVGLAVDVVSLGPPVGQLAETRGLLENEGVAPRFLDLPRLAHPDAVPRVLRAIRQSGCDLVHAHLEHAAILASAAATVARLPVVSTFHQMAGQERGREAMKERLAVLTASRGRAVLFVSNASLQSYAQRYGRRGNWLAVPNGIDLERFTPDPASMPHDLPIPAGAPTVSVIAALRPAKDHATALAAWPEVLKVVPEARLLVVGAGPRRLLLEGLARELGITDRVIFSGPRTDVTRIVRASTVVALPTTTEALPTVLLEAGACGRPVVASDVGGVCEVVSNGDTGLLVPPHDPSAFAEALVRLLLDEPGREAMGRRARKRVLEQFSMGRWMSELCSVYEAAMNLPSTTRSLR